LLYFFQVKRRVALCNKYKIRKEEISGILNEEGDKELSVD